jgi:hypothetical protein
MLDRSRKRSRSADQLDKPLVDSAKEAQAWETAVREGEKNPAAVALGRLGGMKGGAARAKKLSPERRSEIARRAAASRWKRNDY